jgi:hypothetical protein
VVLMPTGDVHAEHAPDACCELGRIDNHHPLPTNLRLYVDPYGFTYRLCERHYLALITGLLHAEGSRRQTRPMGRAWSGRGTRPKRERR